MLNDKHNFTGFNDDSEEIYGLYDKVSRCFVLMAPEFDLIEICAMLLSSKSQLLLVRRKTPNDVERVKLTNDVGIFWSMEDIVLPGMYLSQKSRKQFCMDEATLVYNVSLAEDVKSGKIQLDTASYELHKIALLTYKIVEYFFNGITRYEAILSEIDVLPLENNMHQLKKQCYRKIYLHDGTAEQLDLELCQLLGFQI